MVQHICGNSYAICKNLGLSPAYDQQSFLLVARFLRSNNQIPTLTSVPCAPIMQPEAIRGLHVKQANKKRSYIVKVIGCFQCYKRVRFLILSHTSDYDCILVMMLGFSRNGRLEVTLFICVYHFWNCQCNQENRNGSLTCPKCYCGTQGLQLKPQQFKITSLLKAFCQLGTDET